MYFLPTFFFIVQEIALIFLPKLPPLCEVLFCSPLSIYGFPFICLVRIVYKRQNNEAMKSIDLKRSLEDSKSVGLLYILCSSVQNFKQSENKCMFLNCLALVTCIPGSESKTCVIKRHELHI